MKRGASSCVHVIEMGKTWTSLGLLAMAVPLGSCETKECTLIGCVDEVIISLRREDGAALRLPLRLGIDGKTIECKAPDETGTAVCTPTIRVRSQEIRQCRPVESGNVVSADCTPTGRFEQTIEILLDTPTAIQVTIAESEGGASKTFKPAYTTFEPNGPGCGPTCRQWSEVWTLPASEGR